MSIYGNPVMLGGGGGGGSSRELTLAYTIPNTYQEVEYLNFPGESWLKIPYTHIGEMFIRGQDESTDDYRLQRVPAGYREATNSDYDWNARLPRATQYNRYFFTRAPATNALLDFIDNGDNSVSCLFFTLGLRASTSYLYIGKYYSSTDVSGGSPFKGKLFKAYIAYRTGSTGVQYFDFYLVPCYRKSDNVPGLYDVINSVFYTNQGTGTITPGPDV